jgi:hypothetical protein
MRIYEVRPRGDKRGVDVISDALPFGRLWYVEPEAVVDGLCYARFTAVHMTLRLGLFGGSGDVIVTYEQAG